ncbi:hypothetical protein PNOK_0606600 [Pyrrhoderma noxium]|uniref:Uncharacterized protein n=1 Tax=Pyrrhoderma noxium TaxID=2282107 RepID=A0A286UDB5_9AGAM|nr:hypothetical protein PNOK_0606600 [Pyrrhoderma noxium]
MFSPVNTSPLPLPAVKPPLSHHHPVRYSSLPKLFSKHSSLDRDQDRPKFWLYDSLRLLTMSANNSLFDVVVPAEWSLMEHRFLSWHSASVGYLNQPLSRPIAGASIGVLLTQYEKFVDNNTLPLRDFDTELFKLLWQAHLITPTERAAYPDTTILEHLKVAIIPSFIWPPEDPANLLAPFLSSSMNPSDPDGGPSGSYKRIKPSQSNNSVPQVTPPHPPKRRHPNPPDPAAISASEDTILLASKSGATPCYRCVISCRDCPYCDHCYTHCIRQKQVCFTAESRPDKVLLANYAILLAKWHDKFDLKKCPSVLDAGPSALCTSVPPIKLHPCSGKKHVIDDTSTPLSPGLDSSIEVASPPSAFRGLKPGSYGSLSKAIPEVVIILRPSKLRPKAKPSSQPEPSVVDRIDLDAEANNLITFDNADLRNNTPLVELSPPSPAAPFSLFLVLENPTPSPPIVPTVAVALASPTALVLSSTPAPSEPSLDMSIAVPDDTPMRADKAPLESATQDTMPPVVPSSGTPSLKLFLSSRSTPDPSFPLASADPILPAGLPYFNSPLLLGPLEGASSSESATLGPDPDSPLTVKPTKPTLTTPVVAPILLSEGGLTLHGASAIPALVHRVRSVSLGLRPSAPPSLSFLAFSSHLPPRLAVSPTLGESSSHCPYLRDPPPTSLNAAHLHRAQAAMDNHLDQAVQQLDAWRAHFSQLLADAEAVASASLPAKPFHELF